MARLVPLENDVIPKVLLVNMHLIKGTWIILSCGVAGYRAILMDRARGADFQVGGLTRTRKREPTRAVQGHAPPGKFEILFF